MCALVQWIHVLAAIVAVGGLVFLRFVLIPSSEQLDAGARLQLLDQVQRRYRPILWACIGLLFITGLYNLGVVVVREGLTVKLYATIFLVKIVLAFIFFGLGFALTLPGDLFKGLKNNRKQWLVVNSVVAVIVVLLSAFLRRL